MGILSYKQAKLKPFFPLLVNDSHTLNNLLWRFWVLRHSKEIQTVKPEEKLARDTVRVLDCLGRPRTITYQIISQ